KVGKWVSHELNEEQKTQRLQICNPLLICNDGDPFLSRIITCDEKCILFDNCRRS
ncbi:hypothetical protein Angca_008670, partial [Angiostrongylus cantonensis]